MLVFYRLDFSGVLSCYLARISIFSLLVIWFYSGVFYALFLCTLSPFLLLYTCIVNLIHCCVDGQKFVHVRNTQQDAKHKDYLATLV
jgi:hypothetical protein